MRTIIMAPTLQCTFFCTVGSLKIIPVGIWCQNDCINGDATSIHRHFYVVCPLGIVFSPLFEKVLSSREAHRSVCQTSKTCHPYDKRRKKNNIWHLFTFYTINGNTLKRFFFFFFFFFLILKTKTISSTPLCFLDNEAILKMLYTLNPFCTKNSQNSIEFWLF